MQKKAQRARGVLLSELISCAFGKYCGKGQEDGTNRREKRASHFSQPLGKAEEKNWLFRA